METAQSCARCGSSEYFEAIKLVKTFEKDGRTHYEYNLRCNKCGRVDPYTTDNKDLIDPATAMRLEMAEFGANRQVLAPTADPSSDQMGLNEWLAKQKAKPKPLDAEEQARKAAGLV